MSFYWVIIGFKRVGGCYCVALGSVFRWYLLPVAVASSRSHSVLASQSFPVLGTKLRVLNGSPVQQVHGPPRQVVPQQQVALALSFHPFSPINAFFFQPNSQVPIKEPKNREEFASSPTHTKKKPKPSQSTHLLAY